MLSKENDKKFINSWSFIESLAVFDDKINDHILHCVNCQPERLNPEASKGDAIV
jgi:hypothetical protein